jgi:predicted O-methyltransferase YrrM
VKPTGRFELDARLVRKVLRPVAVPLAIRSLRRASAAAMGVEGALALASQWSFLGLRIAPWQVASEIRGLLECVAAEPPRTVVEIGTSNGGSLFLFARIAAPDAHLISVDLPRGPFGGGYARWRAPLYRSFARDRQDVELLRGDSHSRSMFDQVRQALAGRAIDFLFIDGDHSYDGVKQDFETYSTLVRPGGLIAFHDIVPQGAAPRGREGAAENDEFHSGEVSAFWQELRAQRETTEFVEDWSQGCFGIGLVRKT